MEGISVMSFGTVVNCIDGRVQMPVNEFLRKRFGVDYIDTVTAAGANRSLAEVRDVGDTEAFLRRITTSVEKHGSNQLAIVGHHDCAGNPVPKDEQNEYTRSAIDLVKQHFPDLEIIGLWVNENWQVEEIG